MESPEVPSVKYNKLIKPKPPPKPKLPFKPPGLGERKPNKLRLHLTRMFSNGGVGGSQPPSPTVPSSHAFSAHFASSCENLTMPRSPRRTVGSVSSETGTGSAASSAGESSPDWETKRKHWKSKSDTNKIRQLLRNKDKGNLSPQSPSSPQKQENSKFQKLVQKRQLLTGVGSQHNNNGTESDALKGATQELFDLVVRAQRCRLDDQRCELPPATTCTPPPSPQSEEDPNRSPVLSGSRALLEAVLRGPGPYPMLVLPSSGGYWNEGGDQDGPPSPVPDTQLETDDTASCYRTYFMGKEHYNLLSDDPGLGPALLSVRAEENGSLRLILRLRSGTRHKLVTTPPPDLGPAPLARLLSEEVNGSERFTPVVCPKAAEQIVCYDEHALSSTFKFGVVPQQRGQTTEEQLFSNREPSPALLEFLDLLGPRVKLREHKGYRGGLDTQFGQTGEEAVFRLFHGRELMFHVAPLLPYAESDPQQLQRKRHVGNDIVSIVFQEQNTPFAPDMIASHFLHVFIVIQAIEPNTPNVRYRVSVAAREGVPKFGPQLPSPAIFSPGPELQEWLLTKLINAEVAACKAKTFAALQCRTRSALLTALASDLRASTRHFLHEDRTSGSSTPITPPAANQPTTGSRFMDTVRKALSARPKSNPSLSKTTTDVTPAAPTTPTKLHPVSSDCSEVILEERESTSNRSSVRRSLLRHQSAIECSTSSEGDASSLSSAGDTGLESMSSQLVTTPTPSTCSGEVTHRALADELIQLKTDKLDLQKHNAILQREANTLRDKSAQLESQLAAISAELNKIRSCSETK